MQALIDYLNNKNNDDDHDYDSDREDVPDWGQKVQGDINPESVKGFVKIKGTTHVDRSGHMSFDLEEDLFGIWVWYVLICSEHPGLMKFGISCNLGANLYGKSDDRESIGLGRAKIMYVRLTSAISPFKIERFILFVAYFKGYKRDSNNKAIKREMVRFSSKIALEFVGIICTMNSKKKYTIDIGGKKYTINAQWSTSNGGKAKTGKSGKGQYNISAHEDFQEFSENLRRPRVSRK
jgi:hypothetical protein